MNGWDEKDKLHRPCTRCTLGHAHKFKLQTGETLEVVPFGVGTAPRAVGVLHKSDGSFFVCEGHRREYQEAHDGVFEVMEDFENRVLATDAAQRLKGQ